MNPSSGRAGRAGNFFRIMKQYLFMKHSKSGGFALTFSVLLLVAMPVSGENIGFKFSLATRSIGDDDVNLWVNAAQQLWQDWQQASGGQLEGDFTPLSYGAGLEIEMRVPIFAGLALNLSGSRYSSQGEGTITLNDAGNGRIESQYIRNEVSALPIKIGFSYSYSLPMLPRLSIVAQAGRSVTFIKYTAEDNQDALFQLSGMEYVYQFEKTGTYRSEALGYYLGFGLEFDLVDFLALTADLENIWSSADGFKGEFTDLYYENLNGRIDSYEHGGSASLYYYQADPVSLGSLYDFLTSEKTRPDDPGLQNVRQGKLDFSHFSIRFGIRFKF